MRTSKHPRDAGRLLWAALAALLFLAGPAFADDRNCTAAEKREGDRWAWLNDRDQAGSLDRHLPWGAPVATGATTNERMIILTDYVNLFDDDLFVPIWSAERVDAARLGKADRINCFRAHPRALTTSSLKNDYDEDFYDQGHLTPAADQDSSVTAMVNTFFYTNMAPQWGRFNRGIWKGLEDVVRTWVGQKKTIYVITGTIFDRDADGRRDPDAMAKRMLPRNGVPRGTLPVARVAIPTAFYKIITYRRADGSLSILTILLPHEVVQFTGLQKGAYFQRNVVSVADIERLTGLDFFPGTTNLGEETNFCAFAGGAGRTLCGR